MIKVSFNVDEPLWVKEMPLFKKAGDILNLSTEDSKESDIELLGIAGDLTI